jgi:hypothetical protein
MPIQSKLLPLALFLLAQHPSAGQKPEKVQPTIQVTDAPSNDLCTGAIDLGTLTGFEPPFNAIGTTIGATIDDGFPTPCNNVLFNDLITAPGVWYTFESDLPCLSASTCFSTTDYDSKISVYAGNNCEDLVCVTGNDDGPVGCGVTSFTGPFPGEVMTRYYVLAHGYGAAEGNFSLVLSASDRCPTPPEPPPNDLCTDVIDLGTLTNFEPPFNAIGTTIGATIDDGFPTPCNIDGNDFISSPGVWYTFESDLPCLSASTCFSITDYDSKISVYAGNSCDDLFCVTGNDDGVNCGLTIFTGPFPGGVMTRYYVLVHGFGGAEGNFSLVLSASDGCPTPPEPPPNDLCTGVIDLGTLTDFGPPFNAIGTTIGASVDDGFPTPCNIDGTDLITAPGVWYTFESDLPCLSASTCFGTTDYDSKISVYSGNNCEDLVCVTGNDDGLNCGLASFTGPFPGEVMTRYYVLVHGFGDGEGIFSLVLSASDGCSQPPEPPPNGLCTDVTDLGTLTATGPPFNAIGTTVGATIDDGFPTPCNIDGTDLITAPGVWYTFESDLPCLSASTCFGITDYDSKISVYAGNDCEDLVCVTGNDDGPGCGLASFAGPFPGEVMTRYYVLVHGFGGGEGNFSLVLSASDGCQTPEPSKEPTKEPTHEPTKEPAKQAPKSRKGSKSKSSKSPKSSKNSKSKKVYRNLRKGYDH